MFIILEVGLIWDNVTSYKCSYCGYWFGREAEIDDQWNYCPQCATELD